MDLSFSAVGRLPCWRLPGGALALPVIFALVPFPMIFFSCRGTQADEGPPPRQQHSAEECGEEPSCLRLWYAEYKDAIIEEVLFWRKFEDDVADGNSLGADNDVNTAIKQRQYKHNHWGFYKGASIPGISQHDLETLIVSCRDAIINMKFMLIRVGDGKPLMDGDPSEYVGDVRACERRFKLPKFSSRLRRS